VLSRKRGAKSEPDLGVTGLEVVNASASAIRRKPLNCGRWGVPPVALAIPVKMPTKGNIPPGGARVNELADDTWATLQTAFDGTPLSLPDDDIVEADASSCVRPPGRQGLDKRERTPNKLNRFPGHNVLSPEQPRSPAVSISNDLGAGRRGADLSPFSHQITPFGGFGFLQPVAQNLVSTKRQPLQSLRTKYLRCAARRAVCLVFNARVSPQSPASRHSAQVGACLRAGHPLLVVVPDFRNAVRPSEVNVCGPVSLRSETPTRIKAVRGCFGDNGSLHDVPKYASPFHTNSFSRQFEKTRPELPKVSIRVTLG